MTLRSTLCEARYRARGYSLEDERELLEALETLGAVRLRPLHLPEAGGSSELWIAISFFGGAIATGLVEHLTGQGV